MPPIAIGVGAIASSVVGGVLGKKSADKQAQVAEKAAADAVAENRRQFDLSRADLAPWISTGGKAVKQLGWLMGIAPDGTAVPGATPGTTQSGGSIFDFGDRQPDLEMGRLGQQDRFGRLLGGGATPGAPGTAVPGSSEYDPATFGELNRNFTPEDFLAGKDPGYEFRMAEGQKALERSAAARGGLFSGRAMKDISRFGQDYASNEFANAFNRFEINRTGKYNRYAGLAGLGQTSAGQIANLGAQYAGSNADILIGGATSAAASRASGANALAGGIAGGVGAGLNWYLLSQIMGGGGNNNLIGQYQPNSGWAT